MFVSAPLPQRVILFLTLSLPVFEGGCGLVPIKQQLPPVNEPLLSNKISVCYEFGCNQLGQVKLVGPEWQEIKTLFSSTADSAEQERAKISHAIALMEQLTGKVLGTSNDKAENSCSGRGQMDCLDESRNTTNYLLLFRDLGWLNWHQIYKRQMRSHFIVDIHWTAVIKDIKSQQLYAVDSWFRDNGKPPIILKLEDWRYKREKP